MLNMKAIFELRRKASSKHKIWLDGMMMMMMMMMTQDMGSSVQAEDHKQAMTQGTHTCVVTGSGCQ
jgi:hypothetical protein